VLKRRFTLGHAGAAVAASALVFGALLVPSASADGGSGGGGACDPTTGVCSASAVASDPGGSGGSSGGGAGGTGGGSATCSYQGTTVACVNSHGFWDGSACYDLLENPQPPAGDPAWGGNSPSGGGMIYWQYCPYQTGVDSGVIYQAYLAAAPPNQPVVDVADAATRAVAQAELQAYKMKIGSAPAAGSTGLVRMPVWLWTSTPWTKLTASADAGGGVTVTATATIGSITWSTGDGHVFTCYNRGTKYSSSYGISQSPNCGFSGYLQPSDPSYTISATANWLVSWNSTIGIDGPGPEAVPRTSVATVTIDQAQTLN